jgi:hypothetical protein
MSDSSFYKQNTLPGISSGEISAPPLPATIGPYKIESLLNKGGMSFLYLGLHPQTKKTLAIKVLSPQFVTHPETVERFLKEAEIIALTDHPNIVKLYGQGEWEGGLYISMELIRGVSLRQFILQQSLSLKRCVDIVLQVAYALLHLHTHGVIHRDLKPENILITEEGEIKVIDFGIAQLHDDIDIKNRMEGGMMGTPHYMSPEQKEDPSKVNYSSDIYSLGIIAYELVLGKLSYGVLNLTLLPKGLRKIISKALAVSVKERYQDIVDFITDLTQYLKSGDLERDRPGNDQLKEVMETAQKAQSSLSPALLPDWPVMEIGMAKYKGPAQLGWYCDFFKLPNNTYAILVAESLSSNLDGVVFIGVLRGMIRTLMHDKSPMTTKAFNTLNFIRTLNRMVAEDSLGQRFSLSFVLLDPLNDQLTFLSCGLGSLFHIPQGGTMPRKLQSQNLPLGVDINADFSETNDNWNAGDTLILHTLDTAQNTLEADLTSAIVDNLSLSPRRQAEAIFKSLSITSSFALQKSPKTLISLQRVL